MKLSLNGATTMKADLATDIRAARAAGFDGIEIWSAKLGPFLESHTTAELKELLRKQDLEACSINSLERITFRDGASRRELGGECERLCRVAAEIGCPLIVVVPGPRPVGAADNAVLAESVEVLEELSRIAESFGVGLAFEFLGQPECSVRTLEDAARIVESLARPNVGLVLDSFHFHVGRSLIQSIAELPAARLNLFHLNDVEDRPRVELEDRHRLLPGLGILPLGDIVDALRRIGFDGVASVEIFRPEYWDRDPFELARDARRAAAQVLGMA